MKKRLFVFWLALICLMSSLHYPIYASESIDNDQMNEFIQDADNTDDSTDDNTDDNTNDSTDDNTDDNTNDSTDDNTDDNTDDSADDTLQLSAPVIYAENVASTGAVHITWQSVDGAVSYKVYRSTNQEGDFQQVFSTSGTSYKNTSAKVGILYFYKIQAVAENGQASEPSNIVSGVRDLARPVVKASNVESSGKVRLTWEAVEGAVKYQVYRSTDQNGTYTRMYTTTTTSYTNTNAEPEVQYYYKVRAIAENPEADSAFSVVDSRFCDLPRPVVTANNVDATGKIRLTWKAVEGAVKYKVYRSESKDGTYKLMYTTNGTSYTNSNAKPGVRYYYKVRAIAEDTSANSAHSKVVSRICDLPQPKIQIYTYKNGKPRITWEPIEDAVQYKVYRSTEKDSGYKLMYTTTDTTYTNIKAEIGVTYYYKVRAISKDTAANSSYSKIVKGKAVQNVYQYVFSSFETYQSGTAGRNTNMTLACEAINGTILAPGDSFSFNEVVGPRTEKKGYQIATVFNDVGYGRGGGICQVATTLYNTALYGNLKITLRYNHSQTVGYVPLGRDATIYTTKKDLRFVNNTNYYIKIYAKSENGHVKFQFLTREKSVSPSKDVELKVTKKGDIYTLRRYYKGTLNYTTTSKYT